MTSLKITITSVTNIAVIIGLLLVGYEIHQANTALEREFELLVAESLSRGTEEYHEFTSPIVGNRELAELWISGIAGEELDEVDEIRFRMLAAELIQLRRGMFDRWSLVLKTDVDWVFKYVKADIERVGLKKEYEQFVHDHPNIAFSKGVRKLLQE